MSGPLEIEFRERPLTAEVGRAAMLRLTLRRPADRPGRLKVISIECQDRPADVVVDKDLLTVGVELAAGEAVAVTVGLRILRPQEFDLSRLRVAVFEDDKDFNVPLESHVLSVRPALGREVEVSVESLCRYEQGTKVRIAFAHRGATTFEAFALRFEPEDAIRGGQTVVRRDALRPGDVGVVDLVVAGNELTAKLAAFNNAATQTLVLPPLLPRAEVERFRFLEPRRLATDRVRFAEETSAGIREVAPEHAAYPIRGGRKYTLTLEPQDATVTAIRPRDLPKTLHVLGQSYDADRRRWRFVLDISANELMTEPGTLYYEADRADGTAMGEIPLLVRPPAWRQFKFAATLGVTLTVQGIASAAKALGDSDRALWDAVAGFELTKDYPKLFLLTIPVAWLAIWVFDRVRTIVRR